MNQKKEMRFDLKFTTPELEQGFEASRHNYQIKLGRIQMLIMFLSLLGGWVLNPYNLDRKASSNIIYNLAKTLACIAILVITKYKPKWTRFIYFITIISMIIMYLENGRGKESLRKDINNLINGGLIQFLNISCILVKLPWYWSSVIVTLTTAMVAFRFTDFSVNYEQNFYPLYSLIINMFLVIISSYMLEFYERASFLERSKYEQSLKIFKHIIRDVLPCSVIIYSKSGVLFFNNDAKKTFKEDLNTNIMKKLEEVFVEIKGPNFIKEKEKLKGFISEVASIKEDYFEIEHGGSKSDLIKLPTVIDCENLKESNFNKNSFTNYYGKYRKQNENKNSAYEKSLHFDIKIGNVLWEGVPAKIILMIEDPKIQKIKFFRKRDAYKDKLLATISHDLRTPLNGIMGMIESAKLDVQEPIIKKRLEIAMQSSNHLMYMINDILDMTQINNGSLRLNICDFDVLACIQEVCNLINFQADKKGISFEIENISERTDKYISITSDPLRLKQILFNIIGNALKFTDLGSIKLKYGWASCFEDWEHLGNKALVFEVVDTGIGIRKEDIKKLFHMFGTPKKNRVVDVNQTGVGIGLSISQNLVKSLNKFLPTAEIRVRSIYGQGSTFSFPLISYTPKSIDSLPLVDIDERLDTDSPFFDLYDQRDVCLEVTRNILPKEAKKRILIVDDDLINILVASEFIKSYRSFDYEVAMNGQAAVDIVKARAQEMLFYDVILMDCNMPVLDGYQASRIIMKEVKENNIPPVTIIAITANRSTKDMDECFASGMKDYLSKPFKSAELKKKIDDALRKIRISERELLTE